MSKLYWMEPEALTPPHRVTKPEQVVELAYSMRRYGWLGASLVGYFDSDGVQLLSGTHRRSAAILAGLGAIPVVLWDRESVESFWGTPYWQYLMESGND